MEIRDGHSLARQTMRIHRARNRIGQDQGPLALEFNLHVIKLITSCLRTWLVCVLASEKELSYLTIKVCYQVIR